MDWKEKLEFLVQQYLKEHGEKSRKDLEYLMEDVGLVNVYLPGELKAGNVADSILWGLTSGFQLEELKTTLSSYPDKESLKDFDLRGLLETAIYTDFD